MCATFRQLVSTFVLATVVHASADAQVTKIFVGPRVTVSLEDCELVRESEDSGDGSRWVSRIPLQNIKCEQDEHNNAYALDCRSGGEIGSALNKSSGKQFPQSNIIFGSGPDGNGNILSKKDAQRISSEISKASMRCSGRRQTVQDIHPVGTTVEVYKWGDNFNYGYTAEVTKIIRSNHSYEVKITNIESGSFRHLNSNNCSNMKYLEKFRDEGQKLSINVTCIR